MLWPSAKASHTDMYFQSSKVVHVRYKTLPLPKHLNHMAPIPKLRRSLASLTHRPLLRPVVTFFSNLTRQIANHHCFAPTIHECSNGPGVVWWGCSTTNKIKRGAWERNKTSSAHWNTTLDVLQNIPDTLWPPIVPICSFFRFPVAATLPSNAGATFLAEEGHSNAFPAPPPVKK